MPRWRDRDEGNREWIDTAPMNPPFGGRVVEVVPDRNLDIITPEYEVHLRKGRKYKANLEYLRRIGIPAPITDEMAERLEDIGSIARVLLRDGVTFEQADKLITRMGELSRRA